MKLTAIERRYEKLRTWRNKLAKKKKVRPFLIFSNRVLRDIATENPENEIELRGIFGIGPMKMEKYGKEVLKRLDGRV